MKNIIAKPVRPGGRFAIVGVGAGAVLVGGLVLLGWALDIAVLKSVLPGWVAMKPNTAVAFILIGLAVLYSGRTSPSTVHRFLPRLCGWLAGLIGLLSLAEYAFDWNPGFDQWLFPEPAGAVGTSHPGRMAPDAAICFALLAVGWELARRVRESASLPVAPLILGALVTTIGLAEVLSCFSPALRTYGWGGLTMMALPTAILFTLLGVALVGSAAPRKASAAPGGSAQPFARTEYAIPIKFLLIFAALAIGIIAAGTSYYRSIEQNFVTGVDHQLSAIADLKVNQLALWRRERLGDAALLLRNPALAGLVRRYLTQPADADAQHQLQDWLGKYPGTLGFEQVRLIDAAGVSRLTIPVEGPPPSDFILQRGLATLQSGRMDMVDFYRSATDGRIYLALLVPVFDEANASRPLGVFVLRIDPALYLFPSIQGWPVPSRSAETLLVRREGNEVLYLNDLRFRPQSALALRAPLDRRDLPSARAVRGETSTMEGSDYRGVPVVAALRAIPDSPWFLVAKLDREEAYAPIRGQLWEVFAAVVGILFAAGAGVGLVWGEQRGQFYRKQAASAEALRETGQLLAEAQAMAKLGGYALDFTSGRWTCSAALDEVLGLDLSSDHTVASWQALIHPDDRTMMADYFNQEVISRKQSFNQEYRIIRPRDGAVRWVHGLGQLQFSADGRLETMRGSIQDITERKLAEAALQQSESLLDETGRIAKIGGWTIDLATGKLRWTKEVYAIHEVDAGFQPTVESAVNFYAPESRPIIQQAVERAIQSGESFDLELAVITARQRPITVQAVGHVEFENGQASSVVGVFQDITERKRAEAALRASEFRYRRLFEAAKDGVLILEAETGMVLDVNPFLIELLGFSRAEFLGKKIWELGFFKDIVANQNNFAELQAKEYIRYEDMALETKTGRRIEVEFTSNVYLVNHQKVIQCDIRDITARKQVKAVLAAKMEELRRWQAATLGREGRVLELKREVNALRSSHGEPPKYPSVLAEGEK